jgi:anti-sigma regulatory factor (Ser/Thr protein kinase)
MSDQHTFHGAAASVAQARRYVVHRLGAVPRDVSAVVELMVSELATNCVRHARTPFTVTVDRVEGTIRVEVADSGPGHPELRTPRPNEPTGRGLLIVAEFSDLWGVTYSKAGKTVWFAVTVPENAEAMSS